MINKKVKVVINEDYEIIGTIRNVYDNAIELNVYPDYNWWIPFDDMIEFPYFIEPYPEPYPDGYNSDEYTRESY